MFCGRWRINSARPLFIRRISLRPPATVTFARRIGFICVAACLALTAAFAAEIKPDAAIQNRNVEANVFLDDKVKADPALAAVCLAEGKKWID
jgi:hypothetical protein